jgi:hypothetical protein
MTRTELYTVLLCTPFSAVYDLSEQSESVDRQEQDAAHESADEQSEPHQEIPGRTAVVDRASLIFYLLTYPLEHPDSSEVNEKVAEDRTQKSQPGIFHHLEGLLIRGAEIVRKRYRDRQHACRERGDSVGEFEKGTYTLLLNFYGHLYLFFGHRGRVVIPIEPDQVSKGGTA